MLGQNNTHANFSVDDMAAAKQFYIDKLGFTAKKEDMTGLMLESGTGSRINIYEKADHKAWDSTILGIEVPDVKAALEELKLIGITAEKLPGTDDLGIMSDPEMGDAAWFKDPAGNWICINNLS
jgi:catechol 2,3-dioxygenase-like lactoylglutathione lyase family enzyme